MMLLFQLLSFNILAQSQFNKSQSQVMQFMSNDSKWLYDGSGHNNKGELYLSYKSKEKNWSKVFYFGDDKCGFILLMIPNEQLSEVIKDMNSKFTSNGNNLWTDEKEQIQYAIILADGKSFFQVYSIPLKSLSN